MLTFTVSVIVPLCPDSRFPTFQLYPERFPPVVNQLVNAGIEPDNVIPLPSTSITIVPVATSGP